MDIATILSANALVMGSVEILRPTRKLVATVVGRPPVTSAMSVGKRSSSFNPEPQTPRLDTEHGVSIREGAVSWESMQTDT